MVDWYLRRNYLTQVQADALRKWQGDAYLAGLMPSCIGGYQQAISGGREELSDLRIAAQSRRDNAMRAIAHLSPYAVQLVDAVAVNGKSAGRWIMENLGGAPHDAMVWLQRYCDGLSKHYGLQ